MMLSVFVVALVTVACALPDGAPLQSCSSLTPNHPATNAGNLFEEFIIDTELRDAGFEFEPAESYNITLSVRLITDVLDGFRGFVIQSRDAADSSLIGSFGDLPATAKLLFCGGPDQDSTVTHVNRSEKTSVRVTWTAPARSGVVEIRYSVVKTYDSNYYANLNAADYPPSPAVCPLSFPLIRPEIDFPLSFGFPVGCQQQDCEYFLAMGPNLFNNSYIDIYLEGNTQGWLAVGFSELRGISAGIDLLGCSVSRSGAVEVVDTWSSSSQVNMPDDNQDGVCPVLTRFNNGRISCRLNRLIDIVNPGQDFNLNGSFYLTLARRRDAQPPDTSGFNVSSVEVFQLFPDRRLNPATDTFTNIIPYFRNCPPPPGPDAEYVFTYGSPGSDYFFGARINPSFSDYLDMRLEGNATGWVAIGFSDTPSMENSDVIGCKRDPSTDVVSVLNTYNPGPQGSRTPNELDESQRDLCQFETQFTNGRIICTFSRRIFPTSSLSRDFNLNLNLFQLYGMSDVGGPNTEGLPFHTPNTPVVSADRVIAGQSLVRCPPEPESNTDYLFTYGTRGRGYFFGARVNPSDSNFLDITLEAETTGWVAVGFSQTPTMEESDVLGCKRDPVTGVVSVLDTWNPGPQGSRQANELDQNQDGVCSHRTQFVNGRLSCTFSRLITALSDRDFSLNSPLYQLYGMSSNGGSNTTGFPFHVPSTPEVTTATINIAESRDSPSVFPRTDLLKAHGIIMIFSWPMLAVTAIFFPAWLKPALPEGEWFQFHRAFMVGTLFFTAAGFVLAFIASARNPVPGLINFCSQGTNTAHFVIGIIVLALVILNPLLSLCRCKASNSKRWIYNFFHGTLIGIGTELLALVNVGLGIAVFENSCGVGARNYSILWIYIAFVGFLLATQVSLFIVFTVIAFREKDSTVKRRLAPSVFRYILPGSTAEDERSQPTRSEVENIQASTAFQYIEMSDDQQQASPAKETKIKKIPSKDAPLRWVAFCSYMFIASILLLVIAIFIAI